jgi:NADH-quinone oxidoreductase subunit N
MIGVMPDIPTPPLNFWPLMPELILVGVGLIVMLIEAIAPNTRARTLALMTEVGILGAAIASGLLWNWDGEPTVLAGMISTDRFAVAARIIILIAGFFGVIYATHYFERTGEGKGEIYALLLFATSGMTLMVASVDLIMIFLALEIFSLSLYVMTGLSRRMASGEASLKYFLLGAFSSAFFLYGIAMTYGATGTTKLTGISAALSGRADTNELALVGLGLLAVGFAFKVSAAPFHMWTPDVYQGAPTPITAYMAAGTKVAAFAALIRLLNVGFLSLAWNWTPVLWVLAAASMIVGSYLAIAQTNIKRMLAYSSIAHAGFVLTGLTAANAVGIQSALFYLLAYTLMTLGAFGTVMMISGTGEQHTSIDAYRGLARRKPFLAGIMALFLLSMAGIPPTVGFIAKASVFGAAISAGQWPLVVIAVLCSVVAAFFYLRVIVMMYMADAPATEDLADPDIPRATAALVLVPAVLVLVLGVFPGLVLGFLHSASILSW